MLSNPAATEALGARLGRQLRAGDTIALFGELGAGKTTLSRGILQGLGFKCEVASPTFPIAQTYDTHDVRLTLWHGDLYRIEDDQELEELALDEARDEGAPVIECTERFGPAHSPASFRHYLSSADTD